MVVTWAGRRSNPSLLVFSQALYHLSYQPGNFDLRARRFSAAKERLAETMHSQEEMEKARCRLSNTGPGLHPRRRKADVTSEMAKNQIGSPDSNPVSSETPATRSQHRDRANLRRTDSRTRRTSMVTQNGARSDSVALSRLGFRRISRVGLS